MNRENDESTFLRGWRGSINIWRRSKKKMVSVKQFPWIKYWWGVKKTVWVEIFAWVKKKLRGFKCLARIWFNSTNRIQQALKFFFMIPKLFLISVFDVSIVFSNLFSRVLFWNCGYLFCLTCKTMKITVK